MSRNLTRNIIRNIDRNNYYNKGMSLMTKDEYMDMFDFIGVAMKVYGILHRGLEEPIYQEALEIELKRSNMNVEPQKEISCYYDGVKMKKFYKADFYYNGLIIEIKSVEKLNSEHRAQLFNYMRLTNTKRGLLINFGEIGLRTERYLYNETDDDFILITKENRYNYVEL